MDQDDKFFTPKSQTDVLRELIINTLRHTQGNRKRAAEILMMGRTTLFRKIRDLEIQEKEWRNG